MGPFDAQALEGFAGNLAVAAACGVETCSAFGFRLKLAGIAGSGLTLGSVEGIRKREHFSKQGGIYMSRSHEDHLFGHLACLKIVNTIHTNIWF